ncbi:TRAP transporter small permease [Bacillus sp. B15-48]|uniref:TRAP transporter small permease n=1 Tax=Bacillus sp. B15-48 TaxID=1548601 RepID=UPI00193F3CBC|nr:TRAP transporter small permease [Bacillus sp. B15-48]MBM4761655.1 TRAP transporter small permease subunit [Bacillus sp. B15-48]
MKTLYGYFCKLEESLVKIFLVAIAFLVFISAVFRTFKYPLNWATDVSLLLFAWIIFLGADMALRNTDLVRVDMVISKFSEKVQLAINVVWNLLIISFLVFLIWHGIPLAIESTNRLFQTLGISYSWATISVPVGATLMIITTCIKTTQLFIKEKG